MVLSPQCLPKSYCLSFTLKILTENHLWGTLSKIDHVLAYDKAISIFKNRKRPQEKPHDLINSATMKSG